MNKFKLLVLSAAAIVPAVSMLGASALGTNLITNGKFTTNTAGWTNFGGNPTVSNGHLKVTNSYQGSGSSYYGAYYCVGGIESGKSYTTSVQAFVSKLAPANTGASLQLHYSTGDSCNGSSVAGGPYEEIGKLSEQRGHWETMSFAHVVPATANSVKVRVSAIKEPVPYESSITKTTNVYFDNAYFGKTTVVKPGIDLPGNLINPTDPKPTATPTPGILIPKPTATPKPGLGGPDDIAPNPTKVPTATPTPGILIPNPTSTPTPPVDEPQDEPGDEPQDEPGDEPQDEPGDEPGDDTPNQGAPGGNGDTPTTPPGPPSTGNTGTNGLITPQTGLGMMLMAFGFGGGALALAFAMRRRRDEDDE